MGSLLSGDIKSPRFSYFAVLAGVGLYVGVK